MAEKKQHNLVEIITFIVGLVVLLSLVGFLIYQIDQKKNLPPQLQVSTTYEAAMDQYAFRLEVENTGEESAEDVHIKLSLYQQGEVKEDASLSIRYVPVKSKETAWVVFHTDRMAGDSLVVSSVTYVKP